MKKVLFAMFTVIVMMLMMFMAGAVAFAAVDETPVTETSVALLDVFAAIIMLAVLIESLAEVVKAAISPATLPKWVWFIITSIMGMTLCVMFGVDLFSALGFAGTAAAVIMGQIITGIAVGAGSGFVHTVLGRLTAAKESDKAIVSASFAETLAESTETKSNDSVPRGGRFNKH